jgi:hypothetical protein
MVLLKKINKVFHLIFLIIRHFLSFNNLAIIYMIILKLIVFNERSLEVVLVFVLVGVRLFYGLDVQLMGLCRFIFKVSLNGGFLKSYHYLEFVNEVI